MDNFPRLPNQSSVSTLSRKSSFARSISGLCLSKWWWWILPTLLLSGAAAFWAVNHLLALPDLPGCRSVTKSRASSSVQLYCAQEMANRRTVDDLRRAILMLNDIHADDPFRAESDRWMHTWTENILQQGETAFQQGDLKQGVRLAERIPAGVRTHHLAAERIDRWKLIWSKAERVYQQAEAEIGWENWSRAMAVAKELLTVDNEYWSATKYRELMKQLQAAKDASEMQTKAVAQRSPTRSNDPVDDYLAQREQQREQEAIGRLSRARSLASAGDVENLQAAILEARQVLYGTPRYEEAQQAIATWRNQINAIEDLPYLNRARQLASQGDLASIEAAIREARRVGWGRPLYTEAHQQIEVWQEQAYQLRTTQQTQQLQTIDAVDTRAVDTRSQPVPSPSEVTPTGELSGGAGGEQRSGENRL